MPQKHLPVLLAMFFFMVHGRVLAQTNLVLKEVVSREYSLYVGEDQPPAYSEAVSREISLVVAASAPLPPVTPLVVSPDHAGGCVVLSWVGYSGWAQQEVTAYAIFSSKTPFTNLTGMTPILVVSPSTFSITISNLSLSQDYYFAVAAEDAVGNYNQAATPTGSYAASKELVSREIGLFIGASPPTSPQEVFSREVSMAVAMPTAPALVTPLSAVPMADSSVVLSWTGYESQGQSSVLQFWIYVSTVPFTNVDNLTPYAKVNGETYSYTVPNLSPFQDYFFAVVAVDDVRNYNSSVQYSASYHLSKELFSREYSLYVGAGAAADSRDFVSRETSLLVATPNAPDPVTGPNSGFTATTSTNAYGAIDVAWPQYNELSEGDVSRYLVYVNTTYFNDVSDAQPYTNAPAGVNHLTITSLTPQGIYYVAVVAEDSLGRFDLAVAPVSAQASIGSLSEVMNLTVASSSNSIDYAWVPPDIGRIFLKGYAIHQSLAPGNLATNGFKTVLPADTTGLEVAGLHLAEPYYLQISTVDVFGNESSGVAPPAGTLLNPPVVSARPLNRAVNLSWNNALPAQLLAHYAVYVSTTPFNQTASMTPILVTAANQATLSGLTNGHAYYIGVTAVNICNGESGLGQVVSVIPNQPNAQFALEVNPPTVSIDPGASFNYSIEVTNTGIVNLTDLDVTNELPAGIEVNYASFGHGALDLEDTSVIWSLQNLSTNGQSTITVNASGIAAGTYTNQFLAGASGGLAAATATQVIYVGATAPVKLNISVLGNEIFISWPATAASAALQLSSELGPNAQWTDVGVQPIAVGSLETVTLPVTSQAQYFRLVSN